MDWGESGRRSGERKREGKWRKRCGSPRVSDREENVNNIIVCCFIIGEIVKTDINSTDKKQRIVLQLAYLTVCKVAS